MKTGKPRLPDSFRVSLLTSTTAELSDTFPQPKAKPARRPSAGGLSAAARRDRSQKRRAGSGRDGSAQGDPQCASMLEWDFGRPDGRGAHGFIWCAVAPCGGAQCGRPGRIFVGFETSQTSGGAFHANAPFLATMDRASVQLSAGDPIAKVRPHPHSQPPLAAPVAGLLTPSSACCAPKVLRPPPPRRSALGRRR